MGKGGKGKGFFFNKGAGGDAGLIGPKDENAPAEYLQVLDQLAPLISQLVDSNKGLLSLSQMGQNDEITNLVNQIPEGCDKRIKNILASYPDYFALVEGGNVATYLGYENGLVDENDQVVKGNKKNKQNKKTTNAAGGAWQTGGEQWNSDPATLHAGANAATSTRKRGMADDNPTQKALDSAINDLVEACYNPDTETFYNAIAVVESVRQTVFTTEQGTTIQKRSLTSQSALKKRRTGEPLAPGTKGATAEEREARKQEILDYVIEFLRRNDGVSTVQLITSDPYLAELRKGFLTKFMPWLETHKDKFMIEPEGTMVKVTLLI